MFLMASNESTIRILFVVSWEINLYFGLLDQLFNSVKSFNRGFNDRLKCADLSVVLLRLSLVLPKKVLKIIWGGADWWVGRNSIFPSSIGVGQLVWSIFVSKVMQFSVVIMVWTGVYRGSVVCGYYANNRSVIATQRAFRLYLIARLIYLSNLLHFGFENWKKLEVF